MPKDTRPDQAPVRPFRPLREGATEEEKFLALYEMATAYATQFAAAQQHLPALRESVDRLTTQVAFDGAERRHLASAIEDLRSEIVILGADLRKLEARVNKLERGGPPAAPAPLPPMRAPYDSATSNLAEHGAIEIASKIDAEAKNPNTPSVPPPEKVAAISKDVLAAAIAQVKASQWDAQQLQEQEKARAKRNAFWASVAAGVGTAGIVAREVIELVLHGHL